MNRSYSTIEKFVKLRGKATELVDIEKHIFKFKPSMTNSLEAANILVLSCTVNDSSWVPRAQGLGPWHVSQAQDEGVSTVCYVVV